MKDLNLFSSKELTSLALSLFAALLITLFFGSPLFAQSQPWEAMLENKMEVPVWE